jgi:hypothetical protein
MLAQHIFLRLAGKLSQVTVAALKAIRRSAAGIVPIKCFVRVVDGLKYGRKLFCHATTQRRTRIADGGDLLPSHCLSFRV